MNTFHRIKTRKNVEVDRLIEFTLNNHQYRVLEYEQGIVPWTDDSIVSQCASCSKSFGISKRKHHCRLDGRVICSQCSRLLPFAVARLLSFCFVFVFPLFLDHCRRSHRSNCVSAFIDSKYSYVATIGQSYQSNTVDGDSGCIE